MTKQENFGDVELLPWTSHLVSMFQWVHDFKAFTKWVIKGSSIDDTGNDTIQSKISKTSSHRENVSWENCCQSAKHPHIKSQSWRGIHWSEKCMRTMFCRKCTTFSLWDMAWPSQFRRRRLLLRLSKKSWMSALVTVFPVSPNGVCS